MAEVSTVERAYALARTGQFASIAQLKTRLKEEGCRAVDALLASRSLQGHLSAICAATHQAPESTAQQAPEHV